MDLNLISLIPLIFLLIFGDKLDKKDTKNITLYWRINIFEKVQVKFNTKISLFSSIQIHCTVTAQKKNTKSASNYYYS